VTEHPDDQPQRRLAIRPGHAAGDFLGAPDWEVLEEARGYLRVGVDLPGHVLNPRGQLFGGFTGAYVDLIGLLTVFAGDTPDDSRRWLATTGMRIDYLAPVTGPRFVVEGRVTARRGRTRVVDVRFFADGDDEPTVLATITLRQPVEPVESGIVG
jgi:acyl-coenzyme A thioesterase PaaI-like protein